MPDRRRGRAEWVGKWATFIGKRAVGACDAGVADGEDSHEEANRILAFELSW